MTGLTGDRRAIFFCIGSCSLNVAGLTGGLFFGHRKLWFECDRTHRRANFFGIGSCGLNVTGLAGGQFFFGTGSHGVNVTGLT